MVVFCRNISESEFFQSFILLLILATAFSMGLEAIPAFYDEYGDWLWMISEVSQVIFVFEICIRVIAYWPRCRDFFKEFWNNFDFIIVVASTIPFFGSFALLGRILRVLRVLRIFSAADRLRDTDGGAS